MPAGARRDLLEILSGFEQQCVLQPGARAPPDPGRPKAHPSSLGTVYHRLGGVYPIAHFVDNLVEKVGRGLARSPPSISASLPPDRHTLPPAS